MEKITNLFGRRIYKKTSFMAWTLLDQKVVCWNDTSGSFNGGWFGEFVGWVFVDCQYSGWFWELTVFVGWVCVDCQSPSASTALPGVPPACVRTFLFGLFHFPRQRVSTEALISILSNRIHYIQKYFLNDNFCYLNKIIKLVNLSKGMVLWKLHCHWIP